MRLTLDYEEDFEMFKSVIEYFLDESKEMVYKDILLFEELGSLIILTLATDPNRPGILYIKDS